MAKYLSWYIVGIKMLLKNVSCAHCTIKLCMHFLNDTYKIFAYYNVRMMQQIQL